MNSDAWVVEFAPHRWFFKWRVVDVDSPSRRQMETFMTRRAAERFIRRYRWVQP